MKTTLCLLALAASAAGLGQGAIDAQCGTAARAVHNHPNCYRHYSNITLTVRYNEDVYSFGQNSDATKNWIHDFALSRDSGFAANDVDEWASIQEVRPALGMLGQTNFDWTYYVMTKNAYVGAEERELIEEVEKLTKVLVDEGAGSRQFPKYVRHINSTTQLNIGPMADRYAADYRLTPGQKVEHVEVDCKKSSHEKAWVRKHDFAHFTNQCVDDDSTATGLRIGYAGLAITGLGFVVLFFVLLTGSQGGQGQPPVVAPKSDDVL
eukprot:TRINITY_DN30717_c0_g1_i1.p2 TRINITY_DN30717_c0_g1~~TRINITY_DN30717_c0_g1_i1.p2  ORF type:complete len:265 (+),score=123.78 TRINITY_DN30717_c0_g1_i1:54-848(+)